jgi:peptidyl-tRNA hydrolase, PTH1 family
MIVGLGNPGREYRLNRHNIGFMVVDRLAERHDLTLGRLRSKALVGEGVVYGSKVILAKPQTYMNLSGEAVGSLAGYFQIPPENILVVYDEIDLPFGTLRMRKKGGPGGHNGMKSLISRLGQEFPRLRLGVGRPSGRMPPAAYVLQNFGPDDRPLLEEILDRAVAAIETYLSEGIHQAMTRHNGAVEET